MSRNVKPSSSVAIWSACVATAMLVLVTSGSASAAEKIIKNGTKVDVEIAVLTASGSPEKTGKAIPPIKIKAGGSTKVTYGDDKNPYLNGFAVGVEEPKVNEKYLFAQRVKSTGKAPTFDHILNTNSTLTIESVGKFDVSGSQGDAVKPGTKRIVNKTNLDLVVTIAPRKGTITKPVTIKKGETQVIQYGSDSVPYMDGIEVNWQDSTLKSEFNIARSVTDAGAAGTWDATFNTNNTLTINSVSGMKVTGSN